MVKTINIDMAETVGSLGDIYEEYDTDELHKIEIETKPIISITDFKNIFFNSSSTISLAPSYLYPNNVYNIKESAWGIEDNNIVYNLNKLGGINNFPETVELGYKIKNSSTFKAQINIKSLMIENGIEFNKLTMFSKASIEDKLFNLTLSRESNKSPKIHICCGRSWNDLENILLEYLDSNNLLLEINDILLFKLNVKLGFNDESLPGFLIDITYRTKVYPSDVSQFKKWNYLSS